MQPRLKTSKKWSPFPKELIKQIQAVVHENFRDKLGGLTIFVDGRIYPEEICLRVGYLPKDSLRQSNFETSIDYKMNESDVIAQIHHCIDVIGMMLEQHFENIEGTRFPRQWAPEKLGKKTVFVRFSTENTELEDEADRLLGVEKGKVYNEHLEEISDDDDLEVIAEAEVDAGSLAEEIQADTKAKTKNSPKKNLH